MLKNGSYVYRTYRDGTIMSVRQADVRKISPLSGEAAYWAAERVKGEVPIGPLAMQGGSAITISSPVDNSAQAGAQSTSSLGGDQRRARRQLAVPGNARDVGRLRTGERNGQRRRADDARGDERRRPADSAPVSENARSLHMKRVIIATAVLLLAAATAWAAEHVYYRIELVTLGKMIATDAPVLKGGTYLFHGYPSGTLVSLRRSDVRRITQITAAAAAGNPAASVVAIGNLAMQGGSMQAGPAAARRGAQAVRPGARQRLLRERRPGHDRGDAELGQRLPGRTDVAAPPGNAVQTSPGGPPTMPSNPQ